MRTTDWKFDFSSLPYWNNRETLWDAYDEFYEIASSNLLCCLYSIAEVRMLDYRGFLAILRNKNDPELILNISEYTFTQTFFTDKEEKLIFLQFCLHNQKTDRTVYPILILDIGRNRFSYALSRNTVGVRRITQDKTAVFTVELSGHRSKKIRSRWLRWRPLEQLPILPRFICK